MGPRFKVSSERLEKPGIKLTTPGLQGEYLNHYTRLASKGFFLDLLCIVHCVQEWGWHFCKGSMCFSCIINILILETDPV